MKNLRPLLALFALVTLSGCEDTFRDHSEIFEGQLTVVTPPFELTNASGLVALESGPASIEYSSLENVSEGTFHHTQLRLETAGQSTFYFHIPLTVTSMENQSFKVAADSSSIDTDSTGQLVSMKVSTQDELTGSHEVDRVESCSYACGWEYDSISGRDVIRYCNDGTQLVTVTVSDYLRHLTISWSSGVAKFEGKRSLTKESYSYVGTCDEPYYFE